MHTRIGCSSELDVPIFLTRTLFIEVSVFFGINKITDDYRHVVMLNFKMGIIHGILIHINSYR